MGNNYKYQFRRFEMISVGIDVSKEKSMVCILRPYGEVVASPYEVTHTEPEVKELVTCIHSLDGEVRVVMEATGAYHLPLLTSLKQAGLFVSVINPLAMKKYVSTALRKGKTDKLDSVRIANYGIDNWFRLTDYSAPEEIYAQLRILGRQYAHYITIRIESKLALTDLLDRTMPSIKKLLSGKRSEEPTKDKLSDFVEEYWHYDNITKKREARFVGDYCRWAKKKGYHANETNAKAIYAMARDGAPVADDDAICQLCNEASAAIIVTKNANDYDIHNTAAGNELIRIPAFAFLYQLSHAEKNGYKGIE